MTVVMLAMSAFRTSEFPSKISGFSKLVFLLPDILDKLDPVIPYQSRYVK